MNNGMPRPDAFDGLSEFLAIARRGSFRAAARDLGVTPSAVSQSLQNLERRLGLPLFHRTTRKVAPTEAGDRLLTQLVPAASELIGMIAKSIQGMENPLMIRGHTDSLGYGNPLNMNNWMLSTGRAEATRRRLATLPCVDEGPRRH